MNHNKLSWGLWIITIVTTASLVWKTWKEIEEDNFKYGRDFNQVRDSLGLSKIEDNWITLENNEWRRQWGNPARGIHTIHPIHLSKTSNFNGDTLVSEEDRFHYETED